MRCDLPSDLRRRSDPALNPGNTKKFYLTNVDVEREIDRNLLFLERVLGVCMARHNREGTGEDQLGRSYVISYQPDWFYQIKVTRELESGRQSTKTLFRNPEAPQVDPGPRVRTRVESEEVGLSFEIAIDDPQGVVRRVTVETVAPAGPDENENLGFIVTRARQRRLR